MTKDSSITIIHHISKNLIDKELENAFNAAYHKLLNLFNGKEGRPEDGAPIAAFQFAATYQSEENYHIRTLSIANERYIELLDEFISDAGSILFSKQKTDKKDTDKEKYESLTGETHKIVNTNLIPKNFTPPKETIEAKCDFQIWNKYLSDKKFGKSSIWLSLVDKSQDEWRFSLDFFLILNLDIKANLLKDEEFYKNINKDDFDKWKFKYDLFEILYSFANDYGIGIITKALNEALNKQSIRSAISQVMARNMSHNIGSHVSYKSTNIAVKKRIIELYPNQLELKTLNKNEEVIDWIDFMSEKLDKYEIHRNEYLADYSLSPQSFRFYKDVILPFCENTLILDNIASMEGANYPVPLTKDENNKQSKKDEVNKKTHFNKNKLRIRVFIKKAGEKSYKEIKAKYPNVVCLFPSGDCNEEIVYPDHFPYLLKNKENGKSLFDGINSKEIEEKDLDVEVLLHSEQGLYSILENFIRNSAKHNKGKLTDQDELEVRLHLAEDEEKGDRFTLILSDNVSNLKGDKLFKENSDEQGLYQRMKSGFVTDIEKSGKQNLGFADMNINSFLFRFNAADISNDTLKDNLDLVIIPICDDSKELEPVKITDKVSLEQDTEYNFGYQIELLKPRKVLWIGEDNTIKCGEATNESLKSDGIFQFRNIDDYKNDTENKNEIAAYDFVIFYESFEYNNYIDHQIHLPPRVLVVPKNNEEKCNKPNISYVSNGFNNLENAEDLFEKCWTQWLSRIKKQKTAFIYYDENKREGVKLRNLQLRSENAIKCVNFLAEETNISNDEIAVIYDHHGNAFTGIYLKNPEQENFYLNHSKIVFDKGSDDYGRLNFLSDDEFKKKLLAYRLIDAATTNVFILDERIATVANQDKSNINDKNIGLEFKVEKKVKNYDELNFSRFCYGKVFAINNIKINGVDEPIHSGRQNYYLSLQINKKAKDLKIIIDSKNKEINKILGNINGLRKDILVIHRTYLKKDTLGGMEVKDFLGLAGRIFGSVVVTSGGGYPHNLSEDVRFVPFSIIEQCVNSRLSKLKLVTYLQKLRFVK